MASDMTFNDLVYPQAFSLSDFSGGYDYQYFRQGSTSLARWFAFGDVLEVDMSQWYDSAIYDVESPFIKVCTFPNGAKLGFKVRHHQVSSSEYRYEFKTVILDKNGNDVTANAPYNVNNGGIPYKNWTFAGYGNSNDAYLNHGARSWTFADTVYYNRTPEQAMGQSPTEFIIWITAPQDMTVQMYDGGGGYSRFVTGGNTNIYDGFTHQADKPEQRWPGGTYLLDIKNDNGLRAFDNWLHSFGDPYDGPFTKPRSGGDPAGTDDPSGPGGGGGNYDPTSDPIDFPALPTGGPLECGAVFAHRVSEQTLEALMSKLWDNSIFNILNTWQKAIENPMDAIVSLHCLPISPDVAADPQNLFIGNFDTGLSGIPKVTSSYVAVDCGSLNIQEFWGSALDYSPYTKFEIFLPFVGVRQLAIEDVMAFTIHIKYHVDVLTGDCIAFVKCGPSVLYHFNGNMRMQVPLTSISANYLSNTVAATAKMAGGLAAGAAIGGPGGAMATGALALSSANSIASSKVNTTRQGNLGGGISLMDDFIPYVIIHRPYQSLAQGYNTFKGYPSNISSQLSGLTGYTEVEHVHLTGISGATDTELEEIENLLKKGVLI